MARVGILTITDHGNYGNRLQAYALCSFLTSLGFDARSIHNEPAGATATSRPKMGLAGQSLLGLLRGGPQAAVRHVFGSVRGQRFHRFTELIPQAPHAIIGGVVPAELVTHFTHFVVGSDQVWNPHYDRPRHVDLLAFCPPAKRISYAASFGVSALPTEAAITYGPLLDQFHRLSVREASGADIVLQLTGRRPPVHVDPVMLLTPDQWLALSRRSIWRPRRPYAVAFFLGQPKPRVAANRTAIEQGLQVAHLADRESPAHFTAGPAEFIDYVANADLIMTDSFHAMAFAILFHKPVMCFPRAGGTEMSTRLSHLRSLFSMLEAPEFGHSDLGGAALVSPHSDSVLAGERRRSAEYLLDALAPRND